MRWQSKHGETVRKALDDHGSLTWMEFGKTLVLTTLRLREESRRSEPQSSGDYKLSTSIRNVSNIRAEGKPAVSNRGSHIKYRILIAATVFFGLFFVEYPPLFFVGYWSWGPVVHKVLSGIFLVLNLVIAEYVRKKL